MAFEVLGNGVLWRGDGETVRIEAWGRGIRVRAAVMAEIRDADFALLDDVPTAGVVRVDGNAATITASGTTVVAEEEVAYHWSAGFHRDRLRLRFQGADGRVVLEEIGDGGALMLRAREYRPSAFGGAALRARFVSDPDEHIAGMGLYQQPFVDLKGTTLELAHRNSQTSVPFLPSTAPTSSTTTSTPPARRRRSPTSTRATSSAPSARGSARTATTGRSRWCGPRGPDRSGTAP